MISNRNLCAIMEAAKNNACKLYYEDTYLSYLPLPHILERLVVWALVSVGARICFYSGDTQKIKDDIVKVRPTFFVGVPRIFTRLYQVIKSQMDAAKGAKRFLINQAFQQKLHNLRTYGVMTHGLFDRSAISHSAPPAAPLLYAITLLPCILE